MATENRKKLKCDGCTYNKTPAPTTIQTSRENLSTSYWSRNSNSLPDLSQIITSDNLQVLKLELMRLQTELNIANNEIKNLNAINTELNKKNQEQEKIIELYKTINVDELNPSKVLTNSYHHIEELLQKLDDGELSEDDLESDGEDIPYYSTRESWTAELEHSEDQEDAVDEEIVSEDPPLVQDNINTSQSHGSQPIFCMINSRNLVWKKQSLIFDEEKIKFGGSRYLPTDVLHLQTPYQFLMKKR
ncbi:unnamed protein product [Parnassius apollo]|uniref:(apollo) hypothetical protein n=1 Tax=Parnassius apollo TaxID=110799 RepID=A0A8S3X4A4_PARAO|nr:unnamed protein product [Parnassius apollo]